MAVICQQYFFTFNKVRGYVLENGKNRVIFDILALSLDILLCINSKNCVKMAELEYFSKNSKKLKVWDHKF